MKKEVGWFIGILILVSLSLYVVIHNQTKFGLDINGGVRAILEAEPGPGQSYDQQTVLRILENRLNSSGVAEPQIMPKGDRQFIIELPDIKNKDQIIDQLQDVSQLVMIALPDVSPDNVSDRSYNSGARYIEHYGTDEQGHPLISFTDKAPGGMTFRDSEHIQNSLQALIANATLKQPGTSIAAIPASLAQYVPAGQTIYLDKAGMAQLQELGAEMDAWNTFYKMELQSTGGKPIVTGAEIEPNVTATMGQTDNGTIGPVVNLQFKGAGTEDFGTFTTNNVNKLTAILLDNEILETPSITEPITNGSCQISGGFATISEAKRLADNLNAGALPVPLKMEETTSVEATLGGAAVHHMEIAGGVGLGLVMLFMLTYYLLPGLVADIALIFYALFTLAIFKGGLSWFIPPVTLTLPGIAGFILSVGMAVDANILIFERLKEELRNGKPLRAAIDAGFTRAFPAIRDSNICTLITCIILGTMGEPSVKGFAITLGIGVGVSLFTAVTVTRTLLFLLVDLGFDKNAALFGLKRQWVTGRHASQYGPGTTAAGRQIESGSVNIMGNRKLFYGLSLLIIVPGLFALLTGGLKPSIEFKGGTQVEVSFSTPQTQQAIRKAIVAAGYKDNLIQMATDEHGMPLAYISIVQRDPDAYKGIEKALTSAGLQYQLQGHSLVGGTISKELTSNAFEAVLIAACMIVLYMAFAFSMGGFVAGLRFGTSAIVALLHDVLVLLGSFAILGKLLDWQIDSLFVTATLTVVGFSVHDTIVIFDRLRENLRRRLKSDSFEELANRSILQSFARSINTSFTVVMTLIAMLVLGEPSTRLLNVALLIGIISGTYSSIFNATPILVDWENWIARRAGHQRATVEAVAASIGIASTVKPVTPSRDTDFATGSFRAYSADAEDGVNAQHMVKSVDNSGSAAPGRPQVGRSKKRAPRRF